MSWMTAAGLVGASALSTAGQGLLNNYAMKSSAKTNYKYYKKSLLESPSLTRQGLVDAGYNPLLAIGGVDQSFNVGAQMQAPTVPEPSALANNYNLDKSIKAEKADLEATEAEAEARKVEAEVDRTKAEIEQEALGDYSVYVKDGNGKDINPTRTTFRQMLRNMWERARYTNSVEHAIGEDAVNAIHGGSSAFSSIASGIRNLRQPSDSRRFKYKRSR